MEVNRRSFIKNTSIAGIGIAGILHSKQAPAINLNQKLNILLIVSDQIQAWNSLPGELKDLLPHLKYIRDRSISFENYYVSNSLCTPARAVLYTGMPFYRLHENIDIGNKLWDNPFPWSWRKLACPTIANIMNTNEGKKEIAYRTGYAGKFHLDPSLGIAGTSIKETQKSFSSFGFDYSEQMGECEGPLGGYIFDPQTTQTSMKLIDKLNAESPKLPWFIAVNYVNPHDIMFYKSYEKQKSWFADFAGGLKPAPEDSIYKKEYTCHETELFNDLEYKLEAYKGQVKAYQYSMGIIEEIEHWKTFRNYYYNCIRDVDRHLGKLLEKVDFSNTIVIFTADHPEMNGRHKIRGKGPFLFDDSLKAPLFIAHPEVRPGVCNELVSQMDIAPTILDFAGKPDKKLPGRSLIGLLNDKDSRGPRADIGALFSWQSMMVAHKNSFNEMFFYAQGETKQEPQFLYDKKVHMQGIRWGDWIFGRYCAPLFLSSPVKEQTLFNKRRYDLALHNVKEDSTLQVNLADNQYLEHLDENSQVTIKNQIKKLNHRLDELIKLEMGGSRATSIDIKASL